VNVGASGPSDKKIIDMTIASTSADTNVRVIAVNALVNALLTTEGLEAPDLVGAVYGYKLDAILTLTQASIHSALLARVEDTSTQVLDALYDKAGVILPVVSKDPRSYISHVARALLSESKPSRAFMQAHLTFLASRFFCCKANAAYMGDVFHTIFFPFLLFSKSRQHSADATWEVIAGSEKNDGIAAYELLGGCVDAWEWERGKEEPDGVEKMAGINLAITSKIAGQLAIVYAVIWMIKSSLFLDGLWQKTSWCPITTKLILITFSPGCKRIIHVRAFSATSSHALCWAASRENIRSMRLIRSCKSLVSRSWLGWKAFRTVLPTLRKFVSVTSYSLLLNWLNSFACVQIFLDAALAKHSVLKSSSQNTLHLLQASIVALVLAIPPPMGIVLDWLADAPSVRLFFWTEAQANRLAHCPSFTGCSGPKR
jgi:U3 small nucleolar RNA-associated protein 10